jgi:hypothetical protein
MNHHALATIATIAAFAAASSVGCDERPGIPPLGDLDVTTTAPTAATGFTTSDGWNVKYDRLLINVSEVSVAGADGVVAASTTAQLIDLVPPGPKSLLSAPLRTARPWEDVSLRIGPADNEATFEAPVTEADHDGMAKGGIALHIEGKLTAADVVKAFKWDFTADTLYKDCEENQNGTVVHGLVVPPNRNDTADIGMSADDLFSDDLAAGVPRAAAIITGDANNDGTITLEELHAVPLATARSERTPYTTGSRVDIADLGTFIEALAPRLVTRFRGTGKCWAEAISHTP